MLLEMMANHHLLKYLCKSVLSRRVLADVSILKNLASISSHIISIIPKCLLLWYKMNFFNSKGKIADPAAKRLSRGWKRWSRVVEAGIRGQESGMRLWGNSQSSFVHPSNRRIFVVRSSRERKYVPETFRPYLSSHVIMLVSPRKDSSSSCESYSTRYSTHDTTKSIPSEDFYEGRLFRHLVGAPDPWVVIIEFPRSSQHRAGALKSAHSGAQSQSK